VFFRSFFAIFIAVIIGGTFAELRQGDEDRASAVEAEAAARSLVKEGVVQPARIEDDEWEVDVLRPDGSLVEVTLDHELTFRKFDEELGPGGSLAPDEVRGPLRRRAVLAAFAVTGRGRVTTVEHDPGGEIEVGVRQRDGSQVEVELDSKLRVGEVEPEDPEDE
jgi:Peptidase propeptide and YPEB domain